MRAAPVARARIFSYLHYGLKRFNMHAAVDIIPLLLHSLLIFFLAGLVAFLAPVNAITMAIAAALLAVVAVAYLSFAILPLVYLDCPYRTPFSNILWSFVRTLRTIYRRRIASVDVEA
ncbi:hypothetical protein B0H10DRAFT_323069 [Mycena sp. CBHHK59/15]|nr:hypothetical protein B0H10DRAFT_323069 [Mycena sp. CBHHK59/15]